MFVAGFPALQVPLWLGTGQQKPFDLLCRGRLEGAGACGASNGEKGATAIDSGVAHSLSARASTFLSISPTTSAQISFSSPTSMNGRAFRADVTNATPIRSSEAEALTRASSNFAPSTTNIGVPANVLT